ASRAQQGNRVRRIGVLMARDENDPWVKSRVSRCSGRRVHAQSVQRLGFLVLFGLSAVGAMPAFGQTVSPVAGSTESAASMPDFSGMWVHPYFPGIEPPASGPGPLLNRSRRPDGTGNSSQFVGDYTNPILKPAAAEVVKRLGGISLSGVTY